MAKPKTLHLFRVVPTLYVTSEEVATLTPDDERMLAELGAASMLKQMRELARVPGRRLCVDFERHTVIVDDPPSSAPRAPRPSPRVTVN